MMKSFSHKLKALSISIAVLAASISVPFGTEEISVSAETEKNYAKALQYSMYFYDANMCGTEVSENTLYSWRDDCHTYDAAVPMDTSHTNLSAEFISQYGKYLDPDGDGLIDVSGGFHDAGDHVKFGMPEAYAASALGWGYYEFREAYTSLGQDTHSETILRYFNDYFMKCTFRDENGDVVAFCYQVGDGDIDHAYWNSPEIDDMDRPAFFLTAEKPQTDYVVSAAASLAVNYLNFKDTDSEYAAKCLDYAQALFSFARDNDKQLSDNSDGPKQYYYSNKWEDDYCWAGAWLYLATEDVSYLNEILPYIDYYAPSGWDFCWNDVWSGAITLLAEIDDAYPQLNLQDMYRTAQNKTQYDDADFWLQIEKMMDVWQNNYNTPAGYAFLNNWGSARYNTAAQLIALVYDKHHGDTAGEYSDWAKGQMDYLLGDNPLNRCYIVGYNENSAKYPHHRAASGLTTAEDTGEHRYVLYGALVGGPDANDQHIDTTAQYVYNEVTIDYNAAFVGACAGLYYFYGDDTMQITPDFPPAVSDDEDDGNGRFWVEGFYTQIDQSDGPKANEITIYVKSSSNKPAKNVSVRYFFDASEMTSVDINDMELSQLYDQTEVETDYDGVLSGPYHYDGSIYYVEISWEGYAIANSNKKYQFAIGTYAYQNYWNPDNDWSLQGMTKVESNYSDISCAEEAPYICVYSDGVLVGGTEPDGSVPSDFTTTATETSITETTSISETSTEITTTETTSTSIVSGIKGDVNLDGKVSSVDIVLLKQMLLGSAEQTSSADINEDGKVSVLDMIALKGIMLN